jgi:hypothetical protein
MLRNQACALARGDIVVQWDDDDWHGPHRVSRQVAAILCNTADVTALRDAPVFDLPRWEFWRRAESLRDRFWCLGAQGGTLAFRRNVWEGAGGYPDTSAAEDACFLLEAVRRGARLTLAEGRGVFLYVRHGSNTFAFNLGPTAGRRGWVRTPEPRMRASDRAFYLRLHGNPPE